MFTKCQLLIIANIFLCFPHGIKINDFWEWVGDTSNSDNRAFYKFLQRQQTNKIEFIFVEKKYGHIMDVLFFNSARTFPSILSITCSLRKKKYTIVFHGCIQVCIFKERFLTLSSLQYFME